MSRLVPPWILAAGLAMGGLGGACSTGDDEGESGCGLCDPATQLCVRFASDIAGEPDTYACDPLPASCTEPLDCTCLEGQSSGGFNLPYCYAEGGCMLTDGVLEVLCPGG